MTDIQSEVALRRTIFPYRSLDERDSIRLLHLHPASSSQAEVKCSLIHTTLGFCGDIYENYIAISYVWGDRNDTRIIHVDDIHVSITSNLFSALRDLRHETRNLMIWADAICINQHDDEEKLKQIALMGEIYSMADHTVIYLGCLDTQDALKLDGWALTNFEESQFLPEIADLILSSPWFRRVWVFQELVFSKDPRVQLGRYRFPWRLLYRVVVRQMRTKDLDLNTKGLLQSFNLLSEMHRARERHLRDEGLRSEAWKSGPTQGDVKERSGLRMIDLLRARRGLGVTHPKDMIFAHLGFASDSSYLTTQINYSMNHIVLYNAVARYMIDQGLHCELFDAISDADHSTTGNVLSSWSPDWSITPNDLPSPPRDWCLGVWGYGPELAGYIFSENHSCEFERIRGNVHHTFVGDPPILVCLGAILDVVVRCSVSLSKLADLYRQDSGITECCWHRAHNILTHGRRSYGCTQCENEGHLASIRTMTEILESLMEDDFTLDNLDVQFWRMNWAFRELVNGNGTTSNSYGALAPMISGKLVLVPESTQPGDTVAGLLLPTFTDFTNSYLVLRPSAVKENDLKASLTEIFCQRIRPILHCSIMRRCWMDNRPDDFSDQSTPDYRSEVLEGRASFYDTPWKRIMAGSSFKDSLDGSLSDSEDELETRKRIISWKTFAIH